MDFDRGATIATAPTLGLADTSDRGPTAGNGFFKRWPDDLALFQAYDITDVRLTIDWARLQPKPGVFDDRWAERYDQMIAAAEAIGLRVWATMYDDNIPRWFDNEGGLEDDEALGRWWPRYVERVAERFGDQVDGWVPFAVIPEGSPAAVWRDTWGILAGGPPVVASIHSTDTGRPALLAGLTDRIGVHAVVDVDRDAELTEGDVTTLTERWAESMTSAAQAAEVPVVASISPVHDDPDASGRLVEALVTSIRDVLAESIQVTTCFVDPGIAGPVLTWALFDKDRAPLPALTALFE